MGTKEEKRDQYIIRFPSGMRQAVKRAAAESGRSMNAEIIYQLKQVYASKIKEASAQS